MEKLFIKTVELPSELIRISLTIVDESVHLIKQKSDDFDKIIYSLRKKVKYLRALLRLLRKETGEEFFKKNNFALRDINRRSTAIRNYSVLVNLVQKMLNQNEEENYSEALNLLLFRLQSDFKEINDSTNYDTLFNYYETQLEKYKSQLSNLNIKETRFANVKTGLAKVYSEGKKYLENSIENPREEILHEWRKNVKDLYYCSSTLSPLWKPVLISFTKEVKLLSDRLGEVQDFFELKHYIQSLVDNPYDFSTIFLLVENLQNNLINNSFQLGNKIFAENETQFTERIKTYYKSYKKEQSVN